MHFYLVNNLCFDKSHVLDLENLGRRHAQTNNCADKKLT